ncbi:MAG: hypothetical protein K2V38_06230 [Gemmataceae bacterium]|nr:hypothetical protein [Gemmataceae bacterium]
MGTLTTAVDWSVVCASCALSWKRAAEPSDYEQQALESRPCPGCGAYTLRCSRPQPHPARRSRRTDDAQVRRAA